jgi:Transposase DDE domain group 1
VCLRAKKHGLNAAPLFDDARYDFYAFVTNIANTDMTPVEIIKFYRKRGNAENFIKEDKYGFDLKHYPCLKLTANKAYGLITAFATAYMRYLALIQKDKITHFAKATRNRLIHLPVQIIRHARQVIFKFCERHIAEVTSALQRIKNLQVSIATSNPEADGCSLKFE